MYIRLYKSDPASFLPPRSIQKIRSSFDPKPYKKYLTRII